MLPSLAELMGFIVMALLIAAGLAVLLRRRRNREQTFWSVATEALLPLFATPVAGAALPAVARRLDAGDCGCWPGPAVF